MQRGSWVFLMAFVLVLVLAFAGFKLFCGGSQTMIGADMQQVKTYPVPEQQGEAIRDALRTVLLATKEGVQPLGQASLPMPGLLVVAAPATMQASIEDAVRQLSRDQEAQPARTVAFDIWVVEAATGEQADDAKLADLKSVLDQARATFGLAALQLADRLALVTSGNGGRPGAVKLLRARTDSFNVELNLLSAGVGTADVELGVNWRAGLGYLFSKLTLRDNQWQVVGLMSDRGINSPEYVLLMRMRPVDATP